MPRQILPAIMLAVASLPAVAGGSGFAGATEPTQIANNIQLGLSYVEQAQQTVTQLNQYQTMLKNLMALAPSSSLNSQAQKLWTDQNMAGAFRELRSVVVGGEKIAYAANSVDTQFRRLYPGYRATVAPEQYRDWSATTLGSVRNSLALANLQVDAFASEQGMMRELAQASQSAQGQLQALQAGNQIGVAMVSQLQQLRQLQLAQVAAQSAAVAGQQARQDRGDEAAARFLADRPPSSDRRFGAGPAVWK